MTDRLDRIEAIIEANARAIGELRERQDHAQQQLDQLRAGMVEFRQTTDLFIQEVRTLTNLIAEDRAAERAEAAAERAELRSILTDIRASQAAEASARAEYRLHMQGLQTESRRLLETIEELLRQRRNGNGNGQ